MRVIAFVLVAVVVTGLALGPAPGLLAAAIRADRARRWHRCKISICVLEVEVYGRIESESLRAEIAELDTKAAGCLAADVRVALGTYHPLGRPAPPKGPAAVWPATRPSRPDPTVAVRR